MIRNLMIFKLLGTFLRIYLQKCLSDIDGKCKYLKEKIETTADAAKV